MKLILEALNLTQERVMILTEQAECVFDSDDDRPNKTWRPIEKRGFSGSLKSEILMSSKNNRPAVLDVGGLEIELTPFKSKDGCNYVMYRQAFKINYKRSL